MKRLLWLATTENRLLGDAGFRFCRNPYAKEARGFMHVELV